MAKKLAEENKAACNIADEQIAKMHVDFEDYHWQKHEEQYKVVPSV